MAETSKGRWWGGTLRDHAALAIGCAVAIAVGVSWEVSAMVFIAGALYSHQDRRLERIELMAAYLVRRQRRREDDDG